MQCAQISYSKEEIKITGHKVGGTKKVDIKSRLCYCKAKKKCNKKYEAVSMMMKSNINNIITNKKRK